MSSPAGPNWAKNRAKAEKRTERERQYIIEAVAEEAECIRKAELSLWARIEEISDLRDVKEVLQIIAERLPQP